MENQLHDLPQQVREILGDFVRSTQEYCGENLESAILFGSAAEGRLRLTSDVNLMLILKDFEVTQMDRLREKLRAAHVAIRLNVMFLLKSEFDIAAESFAVKFNDMAHRHRLLAGTDPFRERTVSREASLARLSQVLTNLTLRLRERYVLVSLREEQLTPLIAEVTGPVRASAATLLDLKGQTYSSPKEALQKIARDLPGGPWEEILRNMSQAREEGELPADQPARTLLGLLRLIQSLLQVAQKMRSQK